MEDGDSLVKASALAKFAAQLRAWRQRSGWSQAELADKLLCSNSLVSGVETMGKTPTLDFAKRADQAFDLPGTFVVLHGLVSREAWPPYFAPVSTSRRTQSASRQWDLLGPAGIEITLFEFADLVLTVRPEDTDGQPNRARTSWRLPWS